jgi:hypothetical protein
MGSTQKPPRPSDLMPVDWVALTPHYRAGIRSLKSIGIEFGVTPAAIIKHFRKRGVTRDLKARIVAQAQAKVNAAAVNVQVNADGVHQERAIVDANAKALAAVQIAHRSDIARARRIAVALLAELEGVTTQADLFGMVHGALSDPDEPAIERLREMAALVCSLPARTKVLKDLADALHKVIGMEREAFGLDTAASTEGRPMVVIRDFTGRGDPDAPVKPVSYP